MNRATALPSSGVAVEAPDARSPGREATRVFLVLLALTFVLRFPAFVVPVFNSDETFLATQADVIRHGGDLYQDAADRKPPVVPYIYAATFTFFGTTALWSVRVVAMLAVALTALLLALEARRRYGQRAGWIAGALFVFAMVAFAPQDGQAANFEVFMLPSMTAAILFARRGRGVAAGMMVALATLAKQTGAVTLVPVLYLLARARGRRGTGAVAAGFTVPTALVAIAFGPAQLLYWAVLGNGSYLGVDTGSALVAAMFGLMTLAFVACNIPLLWKLPQAWGNRRLQANDGQPDTDLWLWLLSGAVSVAIGLRFFGHYYMQLIPPLALLAAGALSRSTRRVARATVAAAALSAIVFSGVGYVMQPFGGEPAYERVGNYLSSHARGDDTIVVWGSVPEIYWASGLRPATRFITTGTFLANNHPGRAESKEAVSQADPQMWDYFFADLHLHPPRYIVDTSPARVRGAQHYPITKFRAFARVVRADYRYVRAIDGIVIYERKDKP